MHRKRHEKYRRHHERHRTDRRRFVSLAAIHRAVAHPGHVRSHVVAAVFMPECRESQPNRRSRRCVVLVMMLRNIAEAARAASHRRRRKRSRGQRRIQRPQSPANTPARPVSLCRLWFLLFKIDLKHAPLHDNPVEPVRRAETCRRVCNFADSTAPRLS